MPCHEFQHVVTFGEVMLRLSPSQGMRFGQGTLFDATYGGAESNVAVALANYGIRSRYVTALPDHAMGQAAINALRTYGVDCSHVLRQGDRIGIYFLEHGASQRPSKVIYDRAGSSISQIQPGQVNWQAVFNDAVWFHFSGITPALSDFAAATTAEAVQAAHEAGVWISVDLNYRSKLWSEERAREVMTSLMQYVDVAIGNEEDFEKVFGIRAGKTDVSAGKLDVNAYQEVAQQAFERFRLRMIAITLRESLSASDNVWSACLHDGTNFMLSKEYPIHIVDRVGGGDAFSSGLIYSLLRGNNPQESLEFAVAASCLKQTISGDFNLVTTQEIESLAQGNQTGRIQR
ncbi:MAG: PfkB family carbohydrate kinase [Planctomycetota bacterium]